MGKCGGRELNYVSDVDVIFVYEPVDDAPDTVAARAATQLASQMMQICSDHTAEGTIWPVDANLRPEGSAGHLVRTLASHRGYYERWAKTWEFQALLKARPVAGDMDLGHDYVAMVAPMVWSASTRDGFVGDVQAMRRRVLQHLPAQEAERQLKLGSGGLRDVEFAVQLLQMVHGRGDPSLQVPTTLSALARLTRAATSGARTARPCTRPTRSCAASSTASSSTSFAAPTSYPTTTRRCAASAARSTTSRTRSWSSRRSGATTAARCAGCTRSCSTGRCSAPWPGSPGDDVRLSTEAASARLSALGYQDPAAALRHLEAMTAGISRTAAIQRTLLPVMLEWFADAPDPDAGLFGFRRISDALGSTHWYLAMLRDEGEVAERLARVLATSRYATDLLQREPQGVRVLGGDLTPLSSESLTKEMLAAASRKESADDRVRAVRAVRRRELLRIAVGELVGELEVTAVGAGLSNLTDATLEATLTVARETVAAQRGLDAPPTLMAVIAMGRYGGFELSYGSDADVMFVHDPVEGVDPQVATTYATAVANELRRMLALPASDPPLEVDAGLRPEGKQGALVRTIDSYAAYYAKWSQAWEFQALLRADAVVGDEDLRRRFTELVDPLRFPEKGISAGDITEVRRIKARVDDERLPRGADPHLHLKLGRGGLADIEWTVQLLQMRHAGQHHGLRTPRTLDALRAAAEAGLLDPDDAQTLARAWRSVSAIRNAVTLVRGKLSDQLPRDPRERAAVAAVLGYKPGETDAMVNDYLRTTRRAHTVVDRVFWG